jgi:hypothetical protein
MSSHLKPDPFPLTFFDIRRSRHLSSATSPDLPDRILDLLRFRSIFILLPRTSHPSDFVNFFLDHPRALSIHSLMFFDIPQFRQPADPRDH